MLVQKKLADPYRQYRENQVFMSSPIELVVMLFDGALRFVRRASAAFERQQYDEARLYLDRTQQIIIELSAALDFSRGELSRNLYSLYQYLHFQLLKIDIGRDGEQLGEIERILLSLKESWAAAGRLSGSIATENSRKGDR